MKLFKRLFSNKWVEIKLPFLKKKEHEENKYEEENKDEEE